MTLSVLVIIWIAYLQLNRVAWLPPSLNRICHVALQIRLTCREGASTCNVQVSQQLKSNTGGIKYPRTRTYNRIQVSLRVHVYRYTSTYDMSTTSKQEQYFVRVKEPSTRPDQRDGRRQRFDARAAAASTRRGEAACRRSSRCRGTRRDRTRWRGSTLQKTASPVRIQALVRIRRARRVQQVPVDRCAGRSGFSRQWWTTWFSSCCLQKSGEAEIQRQRQRRHWRHCCKSRPPRARTWGCAPRGARRRRTAWRTRAASRSQRLSSPTGCARRRSRRRRRRAGAPRRWRATRCPEGPRWARAAPRGSGARFARATTQLGREYE